MDINQKTKSDANLLSLIPSINQTLSTKSNKNFKTLTKFDSPKNLNSSGGIHINTNAHTHNINPIYTNNSFGLINKKYSITNNFKTNYSKIGSINSSISKNSITNYISTSTLQSGFPSYSIPKEKRFDDNNNKSICSTIYNLPEFKRTGITIPHSIRKNPFVKKDEIPSPQDYVISTVFDDNLKHKRGISISTKHSIKVNKINIK
jgi:hypothetical protein